MYLALVALAATSRRRRRSAVLAASGSTRALSSARSRIRTLAPPSLVTTRSMRRARLCATAVSSGGRDVRVDRRAPAASLGVTGSGPVTIARNSGNSILPSGAMPTRAMARVASSTVANASPSTVSASRTCDASSAPVSDSSTRENISPMALARALVTSGRGAFPLARSQSATSAGFRRTIVASAGDGTENPIPALA